MIASSVALVFVYLDVQPTAIEFLGLSVGPVSSQRVYVVLLVIVSYFLIGYQLHGARDLLAWQNQRLLAFASSGVDAEEHQEELVARQGDWQREHWMLKGARIGLQYTFDLFEHTLPVALGFVTLAILVVKIA